MAVGTVDKAGPFATGEEKKFKPRTPTRMAMQRFRKNPLAMGGTVVLLIVVLSAVFAPLISHYNPLSGNLMQSSLPPSAAHLLGTNDSGEDRFTRLLYAGRTDLTIGFVASFVVLFLSTLYGGIAGFFGGWVDNLLMRFVDIMLNFPFIILIIVLEAVMNMENVFLLIVIVAITAWPGPSRLFRGNFLQLQNMDYVVSAKTIGCSTPRIIFRHMVPNMISVIAVLAGFQTAGYIGLTAGLSFIGLGLPPNTPDWGAMLSDHLNYIDLTMEWWTWVPPAAVLGLTTLSINFMSDGLRDALDPTMLN
jgi:peptide/nickel transport system permease protein